MGMSYVLVDVLNVKQLIFIYNYLKIKKILFIIIFKKLRRYLLSKIVKMKSHLFALPINEEKGLKMILTN